MATEITLYIKCPQCGGDGLYNPTSGPGSGGDITCDWADCSGNGYIVFGKCALDPGTDDIVDKCNDILDKCQDILDELSS